MNFFFSHLASALDASDEKYLIRKPKGKAVRGAFRKQVLMHYPDANTDAPTAVKVLAVIELI